MPNLKDMLMAATGCKTMDEFYSKYPSENQLPQHAKMMLKHYKKYGGMMYQTGGSTPAPTTPVAPSTPIAPVAPMGMKPIGLPTPTTPTSFKGDPNSVVDTLKSQGKGYSFSDRAQLYKQLGNTDKYTGSAAQNIAFNKQVQGTNPSMGVPGTSSTGVPSMPRYNIPNMTLPTKERVSVENISGISPQTMPSFPTNPSIAPRNMMGTPGLSFNYVPEYQPNYATKSVNLSDNQGKAAIPNITNPIPNSPNGTRMSNWNFRNYLQNNIDNLRQSGTKYIQNPSGDLVPLNQYTDESLGIQRFPMASKKNGGTWNEAENTYYKTGGIHINPANKGKFTDYCGGTVTGECIERGLNSPDPHVRQMANFARNARKWKHEYGGYFENGGDNMPDNPGFRALPPDVQQKIMDNMKYGGITNPGQYMYNKGGSPMNDYYLKQGGNWIQGAVKHPGRCTPGSPNYDCPKGSPQWNLAQTFKKHHGFHKKAMGGKVDSATVYEMAQGGCVDCLQKAQGGLDNTNPIYNIYNKNYTPGSDSLSYYRTGDTTTNDFTYNTPPDTTPTLFSDSAATSNNTTPPYVSPNDTTTTWNNNGASTASTQAADEARLVNAPEHWYNKVNPITYGTGALLGIGAVDRYLRNRGIGSLPLGAVSKVGRAISRAPWTSINEPSFNSKEIASIMPTLETLKENGQLNMPLSEAIKNLEEGKIAKVLKNVTSPYGKGKPIFGIKGTQWLPFQSKNPVIDFLTKVATERKFQPLTTEKTIYGNFDITSGKATERISPIPTKFNESGTGKGIIKSTGELLSNIANQGTNVKSRQKFNQIKSQAEAEAAAQAEAEANIQTTGTPGKLKSNFVHFSEERSFNDKGTGIGNRVAKETGLTKDQIQDIFKNKTRKVKINGLDVDLGDKVNFRYPNDFIKHVNNKIAEAKGVAGNTPNISLTPKPSSTPASPMQAKGATSNIKYENMFNVVPEKGVREARMRKIFKRFKDNPETRLGKGDIDFIKEHGPKINAAEGETIDQAILRSLKGFAKNIKLIKLGGNIPKFKYGGRVPNLRLGGDIPKFQMAGGYSGQKQFEYQQQQLDNPGASWHRDNGAGMSSLTGMSSPTGNSPYVNFTPFNQQGLDEWNRLGSDNQEKIQRRAQAKWNAGLIGNYGMDTMNNVANMLPMMNQMIDDRQNRKNRSLGWNQFTNNRLTGTSIYRGDGSGANIGVAAFGMNVTSDPSMNAMFTAKEMPMQMPIVNPMATRDNTSMQRPDLSSINAPTGPSSKSMGENSGNTALSHNNPGNIHYGSYTSKWGAGKGMPDNKGYVAIFNSLDDGLDAMKNLLFGPTYSNLTVSQARNRWVNGSTKAPSTSTEPIVKAIGADVPLKQLNENQKNKLMAEFIKWENRGMYNKLKKNGYFRFGGDVDIYRQGGDVDMYRQGGDVDIYEEGGHIDMYKTGGEYLLSDEELRKLEEGGYSFEFVN